MVADRQVSIMSLTITASIIGAAITLVLIAYSDFKTRKIPNILPLALTGLYGLYATASYISGQMTITDITWSVGGAVIIFLVAALMFAYNIMGGGDVKALSALALWAGKSYILPLLFNVAIVGGVVALGLIASRRFMRDSDLMNKVPYGVAIAVAGLILMKILIILE